jgi:FkbM family methyltransferase
MLIDNIKSNELFDKIAALNMALGSKFGNNRMPRLGDLEHCNFGNIEIGKGEHTVIVNRIDDIILKTENIKFIKIDAEGSELEVLKGGEATISRCQPILYVENDRNEKSAELVGWLIDHGYRCYWHRVPLFYENNFNQEKNNVFADIVSINMICVPDDSRYKVESLPEVEDRRCDPKMYERERDRALRRLEKDPEDFDARVIAAHYSNMVDDEETARRYLRENLLKNPGHAASLAVIGLMELQKGNYKDGWQAYELRYAQHNPKSFGWRPHDVPTWDGTPTDKTVLIWCEQGWGDSLMFSRFMREVLAIVPNAIFEVQPQLYELFELSEIVPKGRLYRIGRTLPPYSYHCSLPSVPATLKFDNEEQVKRGKYLFADPTMVEGWRKRNTPRIGICQRGGTASERAYSRDMPSELAVKLGREFGPFMALTHDGQWESYADTAAAIEALDLVLTVDTSVAHLSGALGVPTWLMLSSDPDWRWGKVRTDCPWYPSMTIFRQKKLMDWSNVIESISAALNNRK